MTTLIRFAVRLLLSALAGWWVFSLTGSGLVAIVAFGGVYLVLLLVFRRRSGIYKDHEGV